MNLSKCFNPTPKAVNNLINMKNFARIKQNASKTFFVGVNLSENGNCKFFINYDRFKINLLADDEWWSEELPALPFPPFSVIGSTGVLGLWNLSYLSLSLFYWFYHTYTIAPSHTLLPSYLFHWYFADNPTMIQSLLFVLSFRYWKGMKIEKDIRIVVWWIFLK